MIEELLPAGVASAEAFADPPEAALFAGESAIVAGAAPSRRAEFATVRACARRALAALGHPAVPLVPGRRGVPQWPPGVVGSMTHCAGYRAAAVAPATLVRGLGIDAEPHAALPRAVPRSVLRSEEAAAVARLREADATVSWDLLVFSAKESLFKAWFPLTGAELAFSDVTVCIDTGGGFTVSADAASRRVPHAVRRVTGRWLLRANLLLTAVVVDRDAD